MKTAALHLAFLSSTLLPAVVAAQAPHLGYYDHTDAPDTTTFTVTIGRGSAAGSISEGVWLLHGEREVLFAVGQRDHASELAALATEGRAVALVAELRGDRRVSGAGVLADEITVHAVPGTKLSLAFGVGTGAGRFVATVPAGIFLFDAAGRPTAGDVTAQLEWWDAGPRGEMRVRPVSTKQGAPAISTLVHVTIQPH